MAPSHAYRQVIRISKRDSAWVYHILEAQGGIASYSTLSRLDSKSERESEKAPLLSPQGEATCDLELTIPVGFLTQVQEVLSHLEKGGVWIFELKPPTLESPQR
ncbi:MAG: hypothetical protein KGQ59_00190 [Bdellovibrionales bacterium]|nr:hypothetical protein [Bdellovibrionales bacterium]